ncbi:unnamed protein product [Aphanomyces euteiches]
MVRLSTFIWFCRPRRGSREPITSILSLWSSVKVPRNVHFAFFLVLSVVSLVQWSLQQFFLPQLLPSTAVNAKISPQLTRAIEAGSTPDVVIVEFNSIDAALEKANVRLESVQTRAEKIHTILDSLKAHAKNEQAAAIDIITNSQSAKELNDGFSYESYAISNIIALNKPSPALLEKLTTVPSVKAIRHQYMGRIPKITEIAQVEDVSPPTNPEWGVAKIAAPSLWSRNLTGQGVVIGSIDTGALYTHEAIKGNWRAENGYFQPSNNSQLPVDGNGHGTHTIGTAVGKLGLVSPQTPSGSRFGRPCVQFMLCPHDYEGKNPKCEFAPHIVTNSWGEDNEIPDVPYYKGPVAAWRKAGIIPCGSVLSPGDYSNVIGVGATNSTDGLASFSSRGPGPNNLLKPDVSAPGQRIRSAYITSNTGYASLSGTSMATPHVAGAIALLISARPGITYDEVHAALTKTAETKNLVPTNQTCGGLDDTKYPNNNYGYGRINILAAQSRPAC